MFWFVRCFFFFSSRRRHTRLTCDWSSDVCSSDLTRNLKKYQRAVLAGMDAMGCPFSVRCVPEMDANAQVLRVQLPPGVQLQSGPASPLCHEHNELLWNMESFLLRG